MGKSPYLMAEGMRKFFIACFGHNLSGQLVNNQPKDSWFHSSSGFFYCPDDSFKASLYFGERLFRSLP